MKRTILKNSTDVTLLIFIQDSTSTTGKGLTGLVWNTSGLTCYYARAKTAAAALALATQTVAGAHTDGGFKEIDATNMPGWYRLDLSDAIVATGVDSVALHLHGAANMCATPIELHLTDYDPQTSFPDAVLDAARSDHTTSGTIGESFAGIVEGAAQAGTLSTTQATTNLTEATDNHYNGRTLVWITGVLAGQATTITDYDGTSKILTFTACTEAPSASDRFLIF